MGGGIAAHLVNLGLDVTLLDVDSESAEAGWNRVQRARPPHLYVPDFAGRVRLGSIGENLDWVSDADWVCEAIVEKLDLKKSLFSLIEPRLKPDAMISTNTSGLQISLLAEGRGESFRRRFLGTHFFNPPRYLKLLELIPTGETEPSEIQRFTTFLESRVGRRVVLAKDTPGFIANRFGMWAMIHAIHIAEKLQLSIEQVDTMTGPFLGRPRSASFRLNDLVGLDIMADIAANLFERCPDDPHRDNLHLPNSVKTLLERGWIGEKAGQGFYRREGKELMALDLGTLAYRQRQDAAFDSIKALEKQPLGERIRAALELRDEVGEYMRLHLAPVLLYANYLKEEISHCVEDFDRVMQWGFGWEQGPFAMIDGIGPEVLSLRDGKFYEGQKQRSFSGGWSPRRNEPEFATIKDFPIVSQETGFNVRDLGDGVLAACLSTKMGTINPDLVRGLHQWVTKQEGPFVLASEARSFSAGYDLTFFQSKSEAEDWQAIDNGLRELQDLALLLRSKRSASAVFGYALGAGLELAMNCAIMVAHPEATLGLPEVKVGLFPGGAGTATMAQRSQASAKELAETARTLALGYVSSCAEDARRVRYLRPLDRVIVHPDKLIMEAKAAALSATPDAAADWVLPEGPVVGIVDSELDGMRARDELTDYDIAIVEKVKLVLTKCRSLAEAVEREREEFIDLLKRAPTQLRIKHMLDTGKPLRN